MAYLNVTDSSWMLGFSIAGICLSIAGLVGLTPARKRSTALPWVGVDGGLFPVTRAALASVKHGKKWLNESYHKQGKSYIMPDISGRHEIVIPNNRLRWLLEKPDNVASVGHAHYDVLQCDYAFTDAAMMRVLFHEKVLHKNLPRKVDAIIPDLWDEIVNCYDNTWGFDTDWKGIPVWDNNMYIISRLSNRLFVGKPLCRDEKFLKVNTAFALDVAVLMALMPFVPKFLHGIVGPLMSLPNRYHGWRIRQMVNATIVQRIADIDEQDAHPEKSNKIAEDYITWHIRTARQEGVPEYGSVRHVAKAVMPIEFAAIHTTSLTISMVLFDLFSTSQEQGYVKGIRDEIERLWIECNGKWNKQTLTKMIRTDSAIRESMRISNYIIRGITRKIIARDGVHNEEEGWTAPEGSYIGVDADSRHHDPILYPSPDTYDAFRFSRPREEYEATHADKGNNSDYLRMKNLSMISTSENFLAFGHGRHACPGRFLVQHEMKMMLAYIIMNYDIELLAERPPNQRLGTTYLPPSKAQLRVRRRAKS